jgi:hypothetical protein
MTGRPISPRHAEALALATQGIPVFPCQAGGKAPAVEKGFKSATTDANQINAWWGEDDYNIGVRPADMGMVAVDLDLSKRDGVSQALLDMLPATRTHQTPSGGEHKLYLSWEEFSNRGLGVNADVRSGNGYVLWPPSVTADGEYRILDAREPEILPERIRAHLGRKQENPETCQVPDDGVDKMLPEAREWCARYAENQSGDRFVAAAALVRNFGLTNATATELCHKYGIRTQSDSPEGTTWSQTLDNARKHGQGELGTGVAWQPPPGRDDVPPEIDRAAAELFAERKTAARARFNIRLPSQDKVADPLTFWDAKKLLPKHPSVGFTYGKQGSHKTGLFAKLGLDAIEQGAKMLFIAAEGAYGFKTARLPAALEARGMPWETLDRHWRTVSDSFSLLRDEDHQALDDACGDFRPNMIFVDVLTRVANGVDINTPDGAQRIINAAYALAERFGCPVVFAGHPGKDTTKGMMGSYLFEALADFVWCVSHKSGKIFVKVEKLKDGEADRTEVFAVDKSRGVPVIIDAPAEAQPKIGEVERPDPFADFVKKFLDTDKRAFDAEALAKNLAPLQSKHGFDYTAIGQKLRRMANNGSLNGYVILVGEGRGRDITFQKL